VTLHDDLGDLRAAFDDVLRPDGRLITEPDASHLLLHKGRRRVRRRRAFTATGSIAAVASVAVIVTATGLIGNDSHHGAPLPPASGVAPSPAPHPTSGSSVPARMVLCSGAPFTLPLGETGSGVLATTAVTSGSYRDILPGQQVVVARGPEGKTVELLRGVDNQDFAVSVYAHGPVPLQPVIVLGSSTNLYPAAVTGASGPRVPFATGSDRANNSCNRWELRGIGLTDQQLISYASEVQR
jgi:hypothetical protein